MYCDKSPKIERSSRLVLTLTDRINLQLFTNYLRINSNRIKKSSSLYLLPDSDLNRNLKTYNNLYSMLFYVVVYVFRKLKGEPDKNF